MALGLGNNLIRNGGAGNPDGLSLDLQFATDKTLTARKGPTPTFVRASGATQVGAEGLIEYAPENQLNFSQSFAIFGGANNSWADLNFARTTGFADPVGGFTAIRFTTTATSATVISTNAVGSSELRTFSFWMRRVTGSGSIQYTVDGGATYTTIASSTLPTTWTRFSFTSTADHRVGFRSTLTNQAIEIWGAQLERSTTARAYIPTTTAAVYGARFDHDPVTLACKGLLIEESRTNSCLQSQTFQTTWAANPTQINATGIPAYLDVATAPDGTTTADKLIATTLSGTHQFRQDITVVNGTTYTISNYFKAAEVNFASIAIFGTPSSSTDWISLFNISTASPATGAFNGFSSTAIVNAGNGWFRCSTIFTATASGSLSVRIGGASGVLVGNHSYSGDNSSAILIWGAQLEAGAFPTSYIPTTTASLARSADVCSITAGAFSGFWNNNEGTVLASGDPRGSAAAAILLMANSGSNANQIAIDRATTTIKFGIANSGSYTASIQQNSTNASFVKISGSYATNDARSALNGVLGTPDTSVIVPTNLIRLNIGSAGSASQEFANGCIFAIRYFRKPLSNAKLQTLTT